MRYVTVRDDDTNALTPVACLERLYRPFLDLGLPVNLAAIPAVSTQAVRPDGRPEGFLVFRNGEHRTSVPLAENSAFVSYLKDNPGFHILQHGLHHDLLEFDRPDAAELRRRVALGASLLAEAGYPARETFVAPYDKLSRAALRIIQPRFRVLSTGWFENGVAFLTPGGLGTSSRNCWAGRTGQLGKPACSAIPAACSPMSARPRTRSRKSAARWPFPLSSCL